MQVTVLLRSITGPVTWECCYSSLRAEPRLVEAVETIGNSLVTLTLFLGHVLLTEELKYFSSCADVW